MEEGKPASKKLNLSIDLRLICVLLLVVIAVMLVLWRPWDSTAGAERKITITGQATVKAEPDQFMFNPYYEKDTTTEVTALNSQIVKKLKELGVSDGQIKNNASKYGAYEIYYPTPVDGKEKVTLNLTVTVDNKELAQKVQDYLVTTNPKGSITPYPSFSTAKQKELEDKAREEAITDARKRADTTASGLGAKIGKVIEVSEGSSGGIMPMCYGGICNGSSRDSSVSSAEQSLTLQPGEDEFTYSVSVVFALK